jgi:hypothetical protein
MIAGFSGNGVHVPWVLIDGSASGTITLPANATGLAAAPTGVIAQRPTANVDTIEIILVGTDNSVRSLMMISSGASGAADLGCPS